MTEDLAARVKTGMGGWSTIHFYLNNGWATIPKINDGRPYLTLDCTSH